MKILLLIAISWSFASLTLNLVDKTGKYPNDNSFVKLYDTNTEIKVLGKDVTILVASTLTYDSLMELLIRVRAVKNFGARSITLKSELLLKDIKIAGELSEELSLEDLLHTAGAEFLIENGQPRAINLSLVKKNLVKHLHSYIGSSNHLQLLDELSVLVKKAPLNFTDLRNHKNSLSGRKIYWLAASMAPVNEHFFRTLAEISWLHRQGAVVHLISPYLPYARSDKPEFDIGVTTEGRLIADLIESVGTTSITVVRAHAPQSLGFFKIHAQEISGRKTIIDFLKNKHIEHVIAPDAGFQKDATKYQHELSLASNFPISLSVMNKERDKNGKEKILGGTNLDKIRNQKVVIIDDETSSGGTLHEVAEIVSSFKPESIFAVVTHLAGPAHSSLNSSHIEQLVVTNTVPVEIKNQKLRVLSIAQELAQAIQFEDINSCGEPVLLGF